MINFTLGLITGIFLSWFARRIFFIMQKRFREENFLCSSYKKALGK